MRALTVVTTDATILTMGVVRHLTIIALVVTSISACTWGTYDGTSGSQESGTTQGVPVDPSIGGNVVSNDGLFEFQIPPNGINVTATVFIGQSGVGQSTAYAVSLRTNSGPTGQLWQHASVIVFHLGRSQYGIPIDETFIANGSNTLPGGFSPGNQSADVFAIQAADTSSNNLGPYTIVHAGKQPSMSVCSGKSDVCSTCFHTCSSGATNSPSGGGLTSACYTSTFGFPPQNINCMRACVEQNEGNQCK